MVPILSDNLRTSGESRRRDIARMTLGELLLAGQELRRRSQVVFDDMVVLEEALRKHLPHGSAAASAALP